MMSCRFERLCRGSLLKAVFFVGEEMASLVAVVEWNKLEIHIPHAGAGNYLTLCGLDGDDPAIQQATVATPPNAKVTCRACYEIWKSARRFKESDFDRFD
jgi:hypothetical protein